MNGLLDIVRSSLGIRPILAMGTTQRRLSGMYAKVTNKLLKFTYDALSTYKE